MRISDWSSDVCSSDLSGIGVPGTRWQIGIEALIGLIPGVGDLAGALLGGWLVVEAMRLRAPGRLLAKMIGNVLFDALLGIVPVLGDLADFVFKSNRRNLQLLDAPLGEQLGVMEQLQVAAVGIEQKVEEQTAELQYQM